MSFHLEQYLEKKKMTQIEFSRLSGISPSSISRYCKGTRLPKDNDMLKIISTSNGKITAEKQFWHYWFNMNKR